MTKKVIYLALVVSALSLAAFAQAVPANYFGMDFNSGNTAWPIINEAPTPTWSGGVVRLHDSGTKLYDIFNGASAGSNCDPRAATPKVSSCGWTNIDKFAANTLAHGATMMYVFSKMPTSTYWSDCFATTSYFSGTTTCDTAFASMVKAIRDRLGCSATKQIGCISRWEIWNEPNNDGGNPSTSNGSTPYWTGTAAAGATGPFNGTGNGNLDLLVHIARVIRDHVKTPAKGGVDGIDANALVIGPADAVQSNGITITSSAPCSPTYGNGNLNPEAHICLFLNQTGSGAGDGKGKDYIDAVSVHLYPNSQTLSTMAEQPYTSRAAGIKTAMGLVSVTICGRGVSPLTGSCKSIINSEFSWGTCSSPTTPRLGPTGCSVQSSGTGQSGSWGDDQSALLQKMYHLGWYYSLMEQDWYGYEFNNGYGNLLCTTTNTTIGCASGPYPYQQKAAHAWGAVQWMIGKTLTNCTNTSSTWRCDYTGANGYSGTVIWNSAGTGSSTTFNGITQTLDMYGNVTPQPTGSVTLTPNYYPVYVETLPPSGSASPAFSITNYYADSHYEVKGTTSNAATAYVQKVANGADFANPPATLSNLTGPYTVATLPADSASKIAVVTDGSGATPCTTGGGAIVAICRYDGSAWTQIGGGSTTLDASTISTPLFGTGGGSANAQTVTLSPAPATLTNGMRVSWLPVAANTSGTPTLSVVGGAKTIVKWEGEALTTSPSDLRTDVIAEAIYSSSIDNWVLLNPQATAGQGAIARAVSPGLTGVPTAPTASAGTNTPQIATTAFVTGPATTARAPSGSTFVFKGDSITLGTGLTTGQDFPAQAMLLSWFAGRGTKVNLGVSGQTVATMVSNFATDLQPYCAAATSSAPVYAFIEGGINDIANGVSAATTFSNLQSYWSSAASAGCTVIATTVMQARNPALPCTGSCETARQALNSSIRASTSYTYLLPADLLLSDPTDTAFFQSDKTHPTAAGAAKYAQMINSVMSAGGSDQSMQPIIAVGPSAPISGPVTVTGTGVSQSGSVLTFLGTAGLVGTVTKATDAAWGVSTANTATQNQTAFAAIASAVNAGTTSAHVYVPAPAPIAITAGSISANVVTFTAANSLIAGQIVRIVGFPNASGDFLNTLNLTVASATSTQFTANYTHANTSFTANGVAIPQYVALSTSGTSLGAYTVPVDFECADPATTIINQTGTGDLIKLGQTSIFNTTTQDWTPYRFHNCQVTGGGSAAHGVYTKNNIPISRIEDNYFFNWGNTTNYAVYSEGVVENFVRRNTFMHTDGVAANGVYADNASSSVFTYLDYSDNWMVCTLGPTQGNSQPCGVGVRTKEYLRAHDNAMSGPIPLYIVGTGNADASATITNDYMECFGDPCVQFGTPGGSSAETVNNLQVTNNQVFLNAGTYHLVAPAQSNSKLKNATISGNILRSTNTTMSVPMVSLNNLTGQTGNHADGNVGGWNSIHTTGASIDSFIAPIVAGSGITITDNGNGFSVASNPNPCLYGYQAYDSFLGTDSTVLTSHPDDCGHSWIGYGGISGNTANITLSNNAAIVTNVSTGGDAYINVTPSSANYAVSIDCTQTGASGGICKALARVNSAAYTLYEVLYLQGTGVQVYKIVTGTATQLGSTYTAIGGTNWGAGGTHTLKISVIGTAIHAYVDGTEITGSPFTDSAISAAGFAGIGIGNNSVSTIDNFKVQ